MRNGFRIGVALMALGVFLGGLNASAQNYKIIFKAAKTSDSLYYLAQHFKDKFVIHDTARMQGGQVVFQSSRKQLEKGMYCLLDSKQKSLMDLVVDDSKVFTITCPGEFNANGAKVKGSKSAQSVYEYMDKLAEGRNKSKGIVDRMKSKDTNVANLAKKEMRDLDKEMDEFQKSFMERNKGTYFAQLMNQYGNVDVPEEMPAGAKEKSLNEWQANYYRYHYWDNVNLHDHSGIYTPQLFDKMNYFFFGLLYHQAPDTIIRHADRVFDKIGTDSTMMRYFMEFILPRYEKSSNIGWDQVYVHLLKNYYLKGRCPWASRGEIVNKAKTVDFLKTSMIGAQGVELFMADTNQSSDQWDWISSHRFPQKYVILWIWDPDCHHCQEQSAALADLVDSLDRIGNRPFEVYAIGYESDVNKWKNYLRKHNMPFVNVGGVNVNVDYQAIYNVHGAPTMIILNADREIIMNRDIPASSIMPFIRQYEKEHPEQVNKVTRWMQPRPTYRTPADKFTELNKVSQKDSCYLRISKHEQRLYVVEKIGNKETLIAHYPVCLGSAKGNKTEENDMKTPESTLSNPFHIQKIENSEKWRHDFNDGKGMVPSYGKWFLRLDCPSFPTIGIHGSGVNENTVPGRKSEGCIRLRDADIIHLKEHYAFEGMRVVVDKD